MGLFLARTVLATYYLISWLFSMFTSFVPVHHDNSMMSIGISVFVIISHYKTIVLASSSVKASPAISLALALAFKSALFSCLSALAFSFLGLIPSPLVGLMLAGITWLIAGAVLVFSLFWKGKTRESVPYRMIQAGLGLVAGALAYGMAGTGEVLEISISNPGVIIEIPVWARVLLFYMVAMFFPKWWKMAWRYRRTRIDYVATLIAIVWVLLLVTILKLQLIHALAFAFAVIIVQAVALKTKRMPRLGR